MALWTSLTMAQYSPWIVHQSLQKTKALFLAFRSTAWALCCLCRQVQKECHLRGGVGAEWREGALVWGREKQRERKKAQTLESKITFKLPRVQQKQSWGYPRGSEFLIINKQMISWACSGSHYISMCILLSSVCLFLVEGSLLQNFTEDCTFQREFLWMWNSSANVPYVYSYSTSFLIMEWKIAMKDRDR